VPVTRRGGYDGELSIRIVHDGDARIVLTGVLDPAAGRLVHDALVALLRDVDRVLVDIAGLTIARTPLLQVFPDALDAAGGWPAARLALVYRGETMRQALHASRVTRRVAVADEPDLALLRCAEQPRQVRARWELPADQDAPHRARGLLGMRLAGWSCPDIAAAEVELVLSELVTNAVLHAGTRVRVGLLLDEDELRVEVRDFTRAQPLTGPAAMTGIGLRLVQSMVSRWGVDPHLDGKTVWAAFRRTRGTPKTGAHPGGGG
jgi:anti-sigma regulatory factor (Ser/Thr protein kinase)